MGNVVQCIERTDFDARIRFLGRFPYRAFEGSLSVFHEARRYRPHAVSRLDAALAQQDPVFPLDDASHHHARILVMDGLAGVADMTRERVTGWHPQHHRRTAIAAEFHGYAIG